MGARRSEVGNSKRAGYEGMGLGLFIAKTLLERTGAELTFSNRRQEDQMKKSARFNIGAIVTVSWLRSKIEQRSGALGKNQTLEI